MEDYAHADDTNLFGWQSSLAISRARPKNLDRILVAPLSRYKLFGTWKNRLTPRDSVRLSQGIQSRLNGRSLPFELSVCPSMTSLHPVAESLANTKISVTAQNLIWDDSCSFTGETDARSLVEIGCKYVILGHSERRMYLAESNEIVAKKVSTAISANLIPIVCVGESFDEYKAGRTTSAVAAQLQPILMVLRDVGDSVRVVIAYEPAWAISTSREALKCEPEEANSRHADIRDMIASSLGVAMAADTPILYGGSVSADSGVGYFSQPYIDGGLVGGASQKLDSFVALIEVAASIFGTKEKSQK